MPTAGAARRAQIRPRWWRAGSRGDADDRKQRPAGRSDLDLGAHAGADAAVVAGGPPAVIELGLVERVLPIGPEPLLVQPRVEVIPRQDFLLAPLAGAVPGKTDAEVGQYLPGRLLPPLVGEILAPPVEAATVCPHPTDDG